MRSERTFWIGITVALALVIIFLTKCRGNHAHPPQQRPSDTVRVYDTIPVITQDSSNWRQPQEEPLRIPELANQQPKVVFDTLYLPEIRDVDTAQILADYNKLREYSDTNVVQYGSVIVQNKVKHNRIAAQRVLTDFVIPEITKTETITLTQKKKYELYFGLNGVYQRRSEMLSVGPSVMLKTKQDRVYEVGIMMNTAGQTGYGAGMKFKLF